MCNLKLPVVLIVLSVALSYLEATPIDRQEWILPILSRNTLLELSGMVPEQGAKPKVIIWKKGNVTRPHVHSAWLTF
uniref:Islet amyloid polypeptide n=1 Tax=Vombatus ursinus TaxID=29139 RepID=A0A4X2L9K8_VOMUR